MARKPGLPKKYAKLGFKKGWAAFKRAKAATARGVKRTVKRVSRKVRRKPTTTTRRANTMPATRTRRRAATAPRRRPKMSIMSNRTMNALVNGATIGGTAIFSTLAVNKIPLIKDQNSWVKAGVQALIGALGISMSKSLQAKKAFSGVIAGAVISVVLPLLPEGMRVFGSARRLTASELAQLQTMGRPYSINKRSVQNSVQSMGRPVSVSSMQGAATMGHRGRGHRRYA